MVFANKDILLKSKNMEGIDAPFSEPDFLVKSGNIIKFVNDKEEALKGLQAEYYYYRKNEEEVGNIETLGHILFLLYTYVLFNKKDILNKVREYSDKVIQKHGKKVYTGYEDYVVRDMLMVPPEDAYFNILMTLIIDNITSSPTYRFSNNIFSECSKVASDYIYNAELPIYCFEGYKRDVIDKAKTNSEKIELLLAFLYVQSHVNMMSLEKTAVNYMFSFVGYVPSLLEDATKDEINATEKEAKSWLKKHKKAKTFIDLTQIRTPESKAITDFVFRFLAVLDTKYMAYIVTADNYALEQRDLQELIAILNKTSYIRDNEKVKNYMIYLGYALYPLIHQANSYSKKYVSLMFEAEKAMAGANETITKLKAEVSSSKELAAKKQEQLNQLQISYDKLKRSYGKDIERLKAELEEQKKLTEEALKENKLLSDLNNTLESKLDELDIIDEDETTDDNLATPNSYVMNKLSSLNVVIMGGHQIWQNRLKEVYPYFTYIDSDNINFDVNITRNADYVFFNTLHCSHTLFYKVKNNVNSGLAAGKNKIIYIGSNNLKYFKNLVTDIILAKK